MNTAELEKIVTKNQTHKLTTSQIYELGKTIMAFIYVNPRFFSFAKADEDERSDFILWLFPILCKVVDSFDIKRSSLITFLQIICYHNYLSWKRMKLQKTASNYSVISHLQNEYSEEYIGEEEPEYEMPPANKKVRFPPAVILYLGLKSAYYIEDNHIDKISQITGIPEEKILEYIQKIKKSNEKKVQRINGILAKLNSHYILRNRCRWEIAHLRTKEARYSRVKQSLHTQDLQWKKAVQKKPTISVSVKIIAQALNKNPRKITAILYRLKKKLELFE